MISKGIQRLCCEDIRLIENYYKAINDKTQTWHCHHRLEIDMNLSAKQLMEKKLYYHRPASELIFLIPNEHQLLHHKCKSYKLSEETKKKMSEAKSGENHPRYGKKHSEESKKKMSEALKGKKFSEEHRKKLSESLKGRHHSEETKKKMSEAHKGAINPNKGKHRSEETKRKISEAHKGKHWHIGEDGKHHYTD